MRVASLIDFKRRAPAIVFTVALLSLVTFALGGSVGYPGFVVGMVVFSVFMLSHVFPRSDFFDLVYVNGIAIYACLFGFFSESLFSRLDAWQLSLGLALPMLGFLTGAVLYRGEIRRFLEENSLSDKKPAPVRRMPLSRAVVWILPVLAIGVTAFALPLEDWSVHTLTTVFFSAMLSIGFIVLWASRDIAVLLMDTGLVFEDFVQTAAEMAQPALAFFTFYSLDVVVYSCIYRIIDHLSNFPHFTIDGVSRDLDFTECLYFSFVTLSTVGYGDILPATDAIRLVVASQVLTGILLILFGVHAVIGHSGRKREK